VRLGWRKWTRLATTTGLPSKQGVPINQHDLTWSHSNTANKHIKYYMTISYHSSPDHTTPPWVSDWDTTLRWSSTAFSFSTSRIIECSLRLLQGTYHLLCQNNKCLCVDKQSQQSTHLISHTMERLHTWGKYMVLALLKEDQRLSTTSRQSSAFLDKRDIEQRTKSGDTNNNFDSRTWQTHTKNHRNNATPTLFKAMRLLD
jgi:hypothetical protein